MTIVVTRQVARNLLDMLIEAQDQIASDDFTGQFKYGPSEDKALSDIISALDEAQSTATEDADPDDDDLIIVLQIQPGDL